MLITPVLQTNIRFSAGKGKPSDSRDPDIGFMIIAPHTKIENQHLATNIKRLHDWYQRVPVGIREKLKAYKPLAVWDESFPRDKREAANGAALGLYWAATRFPRYTAAPLMQTAMGPKHAMGFLYDLTKPLWSSYTDNPNPSDTTTIINREFSKKPWRRLPGVPHTILTKPSIPVGPITDYISFCTPNRAAAVAERIVNDRGITSVIPSLHIGNWMGLQPFTREELSRINPSQITASTRNDALLTAPEIRLFLSAAPKLTNYLRQTEEKLD